MARIFILPVAYIDSYPFPHYALRKSLSVKSVIVPYG